MCPTARQLLLAVICGALLCAVLTSPSAAQEAAVGADARASRLTELAYTGRFDLLLKQLKDDHGQADDKAVDSLVHDLQLHEKHQQRRDAERQEALKKAMDKMSQHIADHQYEDSLVAAIEAHELAADKQQFLAQGDVVQVVAAGLAIAKQSEEKRDWVEALSIYRLLNLLYDDSQLYRDDVKRAAKHVRVLQLYAPKLLEQLYEERAKRRAAVRKQQDDPDDASPDADALNRRQLDAEPWQQRLKNIDLNMLRETLRYAASRHISQGDYADQLRGAIENLLIMVNTDGLADTFPGMGDARQLKRFREHLERQSVALQAAPEGISRFDALRVTDEIIQASARSIKLPEQVLVYEMTQGATDKLDDFSSVIWPSDKEHFSRSTQGKFYGVGIQIARRDGRLVVVSPLENTPAQRAGIKAGDIIAQVNGINTAAWSLDRAVREITGPENTVVTLGIERGGEPDLLQFPIRRAEIVIESIQGWEHKPEGGWDWWIDRQAGIGYVRLSQFIPQTADDLDSAIMAMQSQGRINGLILDLRFNPGGLLSAAVDVADRFIAEGPLVFTVDSENHRTDTRRAQRHMTYRTFPLVVLINQGSASASEIVAGAVQDYGRARIIGTRSFGKGSVQDLFPLSGGRAYLKLTTQYYMLPRGRIIHREPKSRTWGIEPNLVVNMTNEQVAEALEIRQQIDVLRDPQDNPQPQPDVMPNDDGDEPDAEPGDAQNITPPATRAEEILERGVDPQLETALLVLKTQLVATDIAVAKKQAPAVNVP